MPASNEVIVIGSVDELKERAHALIAESTRHLLKIDGNWRIAGNFVAQLESPIDTVLDFQFKEKLSWEFPKPSFSNFLGQLFSQMTGIEMINEELMERIASAASSSSFAIRIFRFLIWDFYFVSEPTSLFSENLLFTISSE